MKFIIFPSLSLAVLSIFVGCATRATAQELPGDFPAATAQPLSAQSPDPSAEPPSNDTHRVSEHEHHHGHSHGDTSPASDSVSEEEAQPQADIYTCPMHPEVTATAPGQCSICGMHLEKKK